MNQDLNNDAIKAEDLDRALRVEKATKTFGKFLKKNDFICLTLFADSNPNSSYKSGAVFTNFDFQDDNKGKAVVFTSLVAMIIQKLSDDCDLSTDDFAQMVKDFLND